MADKEQIAKLSEGVAAWNAWREANVELLVDLSDANLNEALLQLAGLDEVNLNEANLNEANLSKADLTQAHLNRADLSGAGLGGANLSGADLSGANLNGANLRGADLRRVRVDSNTNLFGATVEDCRIDRYELELLGDNYGGLTKGDRMGMIIEDGVALLRSTYSGFLQWLHLFALAAFLSPYVRCFAVPWCLAPAMANFWMVPQKPTSIPDGSATVRIMASAIPDSRLPLSVVGRLPLPADPRYPLRALAGTECAEHAS